MKEFLIAVASQLEKSPWTIVAAVALATVWMTEIHFTTSQTQASVIQLSNKVESNRLEIYNEMIREREKTNALLQSIDQRLSRIEGSLGR